MSIIFSYLSRLKKRIDLHEVEARSAQMTYYWILSFFPFLLMIINILSYTSVGQDDFLSYIASFMPDALESLVKNTLTQIVSYRSTAGVYFGAVAAILSISTSVNVLSRGIYLAYNIADERNFIVKNIMGIIYAFLLIVLIIIMMISVVFGKTIGLLILEYALGNYPRYYAFVWDISRWIISWSLLILGAKIIHNVIPKRRIGDCNIWPGIIFTAIGWHIFSSVFGIYIDNFSNYNQMYGSIGSIFILLIWLYTNSMLILIGAEVNALIHLNKQMKKNIS
ncbi:hypothetical protein AN639_04660 [Candidatus Epulonipiscium fishelsonii]|uniref:Uncharacterized protein n=1 Tax=Candidatus Epulonipiscium fishelsonii TaxID=77094 RepID=A0ACC8XD98_9FIRM|nr:hypothetical protein AN639_04660 [Epulopiscium sp. SCG-B05WGA-EpuloA1]ONI40771.1 hypothetical protein AN396_04965 [Epulopiscium sp. SCG-B11WGA-EpuloA1]